MADRVAERGNVLDYLIRMLGAESEEGITGHKNVMKDKWIGKTTK